jgi:16S rRNA (guanine1207-N2)-methyltransferase
MNNAALHSLFTQQLHRAALPNLFIADENTAADQSHAELLRPGQHILTNRWDIGELFREHSAAPVCNDYQFDSFGDGSVQSILYRVSKEKAVVHHIINGSGRLLPPGGQLILLGHKREGLTSYGKRATSYLGGGCHTIRGASGYTALTLQRGKQLGEQLPDDHYPQLQACIAIDGLKLYSKPGIYGWQKVDRGSLLLIEALRQHAISTRQTTRSFDTLDMGCGYGLLSVLASRLIDGRFVATDNNFAALAACSRNFSVHDVPGEVIADDCARHINRRFDLVLCNPPFHQGFNTSAEITGRFTEQAAHHLKPSGCALFVVNQFVGIEKHATTHFGDCKELMRHDGFKILELRRPHQLKK